MLSQDGHVLHVTGDSQRGAADLRCRNVSGNFKHLFARYASNITRCEYSLKRYAFGLQAMPLINPLAGILFVESDILNR